MRRPLAETLLDLTGAAFESPQDAQQIHITSMSVDIPIEVRLRRSEANGDWELLADMPSWRWQTGLEEERGRLRIKLDSE